MVRIWRPDGSFLVSRPVLDLTPLIRSEGCQYPSLRPLLFVTSHPGHEHNQNLLEGLAFPIHFVMMKCPVGRGYQDNYRRGP